MFMSERLGASLELVRFAASKKSYRCKDTVKPICSAVCSASALYIDIRIDRLRRAVVLTRLFAIIGLFVVIFVLCTFYCIFSIHAIHCISFSFLATVFK